VSKVMVSVREAADMMGIGYVTLHKMINDGHFPFVEVKRGPKGTKVKRVRVAAIEEWAKAHEGVTA
jgi:excisionase family DNA binding protein